MLNEIRFYCHFEGKACCKFKYKIQTSIFESKQHTTLHLNVLIIMLEGTPTTLDDALCTTCKNALKIIHKF